MRRFYQTESRAKRFYWSEQRDVVVIVARCFPEAGNFFFNVNNLFENIVRGEFLDIFNTSGLMRE